MERKRRKMKIIAIIAGIIAVIALGILATRLSKKVDVMESRLAVPSVYYSDKDDYYFIHNDKIYYYKLDEENRGRLYSMDFDSSNNEQVSSSEKLITPHILFIYNNCAYCVCPTSDVAGVTMKVNLETGAINEIYNGELNFNPNTIKENNILGVALSDIEFEDPLIKVYKYDLNTETNVTEPKIYKPAIDKEDLTEDEYQSFRDMKIVTDANYENCYYTFKNKIYKNEEIFYESDKVIKNLIVKDENIYFSEDNDFTKMNLTTKEKEVIQEIDGLKEATDVTVSDNNIIFNYGTNIIAKYALGKVGIYNLDSKKYDTYENIKHYNVEGNVVYLLNGENKTTKVELSNANT